MTTSMGDIFLELNEGKAPISVKNFLSYADKGSYEGTVFHRVMPGFVVQGGGYTKDLTEKPTDPPIKNEWENGLKNARGTIAMARKGAKRPNPDAVNSATSQFYFNLKDNTGLDEPQRDGGAYAVFGKVISGMDVVDKIAAVKTESRPGPMGLTFDTVPVEPVTITKVVKVTADEAKAAPQDK
jgi:cyclophilin family peptidyl-prolyl cis-trans isomerase